MQKGVPHSCHQDKVREAAARSRQEETDMFILLAGGLLVIIVAVIVAVVSAVASAVAAESDTPE